MKHTKGLPRILNWKNDNCPPVTDEFFNITNVMELVAYTQMRDKQNKKMHEVLIMGMSAIIKHGSPELVEKYTSLIKEIESETT